MICSMTGYGEAQLTDGAVAYVLEVKSINNRYFKASIKLPEHLAVFEGQVETLLRSKLARGTVSYTLRVRDKSAKAAQEVNVAALESYVNQLRGLNMGQGAQIDLATILALPGVIQPPEIDEAERERQWQRIEQVSQIAIEHLVQMRSLEGRAINDDLLGQCAQIREHLKEVAVRAPGVLQEYNERLLNRANELLASSRMQLQLDDVRREVAVYAERCDINEELARLASHLDQFETLCDRSEAAGRKLDFLAQEMLREANTIGSKANDATIAHSIVEIKGSIDRIKEQVQNVE